MAVVGAGPAGATAALSLSGAGWETLMIDPGLEGRRARDSETLPSAALPLLERLGVIAAFTSGPHRPARANRSYWGKAVGGERPALLTPYGDGWHLQREHFDAMLREQALDNGGTLIRGRVQSIVRTGALFELCLSDPFPRLVRARGIIDATGRTASIARRLGATVYRTDRLVAACAQSSLRAPSDEHDAVSLVESTPEGWWYSAPRPDGPYTLQFFTLPTIWQADRHLGSRLRGAPHTLARVGDLATIATRVRIAHSAITKPCSGPGWAAVGDAAVSYDPLASAGLLMALRSGLRASHALASWLGGDPAPLNTYAAMQDAAFATYVSQRATLYAAEQRWPRMPFWEISATAINE